MANRKTLTFIIGFFAVLIIGVGTYGIFFANKNKGASDTATYVDPGTGKELVSNLPLTQDPVDNPDPSRPMFIGFSTLTDRGLSREQQTQVENAIYSYSGQKSLSFKEVSLTVSSIETTPPGSTDPGYYINFMITVNRSDKYYINVTYSDFSSCVTHIYTADKKTLLFTQ